MFPHLELVEGKIDCDDALGSHLLVDRHGAGVAEGRAVLPDASSPGCPVALLGFTARPPVALTRRRLWPLRTPLYQNREQNQKDYNIFEDFSGFGVLSLLSVF